MLVAADDELQLPLDYLQALHLRRVHMALREEATRPTYDIELQQLARGFLFGAQ